MLADVFVFLSGVSFGAALAFSARRSSRKHALGDRTGEFRRLRLVHGGGIRS